MTKRTIFTVTIVSLLQASELQKTAACLKNKPPFIATIQ